MQETKESAHRSARVVTVDLVVAALIFVLGALVAYESHRLGSSWGADGPEAGYFPFYVGMLVCISGGVVFVQSLFKFRSERKIFVEREQFRQVLVIFLPTAAYVLGIQMIGFYVPSAVFIGLFMRIAGKYSWLRSVIVGLSVSLLSFLLFEVWFKIPLPKGPVEKLFGF